jgi:hypothetical protein
MTGYVSQGCDTNDNKQVGNESIARGVIFDDETLARAWPFVCFIGGLAYSVGVYLYLDHTHRSDQSIWTG